MTKLIFMLDTQTGLFTAQPATQYIRHALATAINDFLVASGAGAYVKKTLAETLVILGKAAASGLASLNASSLVVQKPADRLGVGNFEWTLNKLLKGAGVGADPIPIDVPAALTYVEIVPPAVQKPSAHFTWQDWDLTAATEAGAKVAAIYMFNPVTVRTLGVRKDGSAAARTLSLLAKQGMVMITEMGAGELVETYGISAESEFYISGYWK